MSIRRFALFTHLTATCLATCLAVATLAQPVAAQGAKPNAFAADASAKKVPKKADKADKAAEKPAEKPAEEKPETKPEAAVDATEEPVGEPDAWERPPVEEEKAPVKPANAPPPAPVAGRGRPFSFGVLTGLGVTTKSGVPADPYGFGFGVRGGYTFDFGLYTGVHAVYYLGSSCPNCPNSATTGGTALTTANYVLPGLEVGYDFWVSNVIVRPSLVLGYGFLNRKPGTQGPNAQTYTDLYFAPGVEALYTVDLWFFGLQARYNLTTGDGYPGTEYMLTGGMRL